MTAETNGPALDLKALVASIATRTSARTEADVQADIATLLRYGGLNLDDSQIVKREVPMADGTRRRIDIESGLTVIEVKNDLRVGQVKGDALLQLAGYVRTRSEKLQQRYVGILADGADWYLCHLALDGPLEIVAEHHVAGDAPDVNALVGWLEAVLATQTQIKATPTEIERRLGASSPAFRLDLASLHAIYAEHHDAPEVQLKRQLWGWLLTAALGTSFEESDDLFIEHTYLVIVAELVAHAVVGISLADSSHSGLGLLTGKAFRTAQIGGVVEADFFDWPAEVPLGDRLVRDIARRLARFDWSAVEHDVLKVLYESVIDAETRHRLGEYYTPDWLAERMVADAICDPLSERVLDPACGSGTFLFWAIRRFLHAADAAGMPNQEAIEHLSGQVFGLDLHPVAVTLARVTYLLAIGTERLAQRGAFTVPVYLGDSVRWEQDETLLSGGGVMIRTSDADLFSRELRFPEAALADAGRFDRLVDELMDQAVGRERGARPLPSIAGILDRAGVEPSDLPIIETTFQQLCFLHDDGKDHIWGYYVRNLARPVWFSRNRVDVLVGNPPWLSYRFMEMGIQARFRALSSERGLWAGAEVAAHQDLSGLFVARAIEQYLRPGGRFAFVMPAAVLSRRQFNGFRTGDWRAPGAHTMARFEQAWNLTAVKPTIFPVPSSVMHGSRAKQNEEAKPLSGATELWSGVLPDHRRDWGAAKDALSRTDAATVVASDSPVSPYDDRFVNGATLYPRLLVMVERRPAGALGVPMGDASVQSARTRLEKAPWRDLESLHGVVEERFLWPVLLGSTVVPYRTLNPWEAVLPLDEHGHPLDAASLELDRYPRLAAWWRRVAELWEMHQSERSELSLWQQLNYQSKLTNQFPQIGERIVYTKSGTTIAAARIDPSAVVENSLYWAQVASADEGRYLVAVLNSTTLMDLVAPLQSVGQFGRRDIHKYVFAVPFPLFDPGEGLHVEIAAAAADAETVATGVDLSGGRGFQRARKLVRAALGETGVGRRIEGLVGELLARR